MKKYSIKYCKTCNKIVFGNDTLYEDYKKTLIHDSFKCYNFLHHKKLFEKLEEDLQSLRTDLQKIQEVIF